MGAAKSRLRKRKTDAVAAPSPCPTLPSATKRERYAALTALPLLPTPLRRISSFLSPLKRRQEEIEQKIIERKKQALVHELALADGVFDNMEELAFAGDPDSLTGEQRAMDLLCVEEWGQRLDNCRLKLHGTSAKSAADLLKEEFHFNPRYAYPKIARLLPKGIRGHFEICHAHEDTFFVPDTPRLRRAVKKAITVAGSKRTGPGAYMYYKMVEELEGITALPAATTCAQDLLHACGALNNSYARAVQGQVTDRVTPFGKVFARALRVELRAAMTRSKHKRWFGRRLLSKLLRSTAHLSTEMSQLSPEVQGTALLVALWEMRTEGLPYCQYEESISAAQNDEGAQAEPLLGIGVIPPMEDEEDSFLAPQEREPSLSSIEDDDDDDDDHDVNKPSDEQEVESREEKANLEDVQVELDLRFRCAQVVIPTMPRPVFTPLTRVMLQRTPLTIPVRTLQLPPLQPIRLVPVSLLIPKRQDNHTNGNTAV